MWGWTETRERLGEFFYQRVWETRLERLAPGRAAAYRVARLLAGVYRGYFEQRLTFRAAALTYFSILSLVPFLAFAFSILKGFGVYRRLVQESLQPYPTGRGGNLARETRSSRSVRPERGEPALFPPAPVATMFG